MHRQRANKHTGTLPKIFERILFVKFYFGFAGNILNLSSAEDEERETLSLVIFMTSVVALAYIFGLIGGYVAHSKSPINANFLNLSVIVLLPLVIQIDLIKQRISMTMSAFSKISTPSAPSDNSFFEESQQEYYLSRLVCNGNDDFPEPVRSFDRISLKGFSPRLIQRVGESGANAFKVSLESEFKSNLEKREIKCIILNLSDQDFFRPITLKASMHALGLKHKNMLLEGTTYNIFWQDIYLFLKAWLVCSLDSDTGNPMPISAIGLNYPDKINPNKSRYKSAVHRIQFLLLNSEKSLTQLNHQPTIRRMNEGLDDLITLIDNYQSN